MTHLQGRICWDVIHDIYIHKNQKIAPVKLPVGSCGLIHVTSNNIDRKLNKYSYQSDMVCHDHNEQHCKEFNNVNSRTKKEFYVKKNEENDNGQKILYKIPKESQRIDYLKQQIIKQINEFAKTIEHKLEHHKNNTDDKLNFDRIKHKLDFDVSKYQSVGVIEHIVNNTKKGFYANSIEQGEVAFIIKWLLLYNDFETIARLSHCLQLNRFQTVSHSQLYPFGMAATRYHTMSMYIHLNLLLCIRTSGKKDVCTDHYNKSFWEKIFYPECDTQDYFSHLVEDYYSPDCSKVPMIDNEHIKKFCEPDRLLDNAKKLFNALVLMQYLENNGPDHEHKLNNDWSNCLDDVFDHVTMYF